MDHPTPDSPPADGTTQPVPCRHLRSKGMYVYTDGISRPKNDYDNTIYWCLRSMKSFGPDDEMVDMESCCDGGRSCHEPV